MTTILDYRPSLATSAPKPPRAEHFEVEFGGFRCGLAIKDGATKLISRNGTIVTHWFPELEGLASDLVGAEMLVDGEIIVGSGSIESLNILLGRGLVRAGR